MKEEYIINIKGQYFSCNDIYGVTLRKTDGDTVENIPHLISIVPESRPEHIVSKHLGEPGEFQVWRQYWCERGKHNPPYYYGTFKADNFKEACKLALIKHHETGNNGGPFDGEPLEHYDEDKNMEWGHKFFDNESQAWMGKGPL